MTYSVRIRPRAEADIRDAHGWYARIGSDLGERFADELGRVLESVGTDPLIYARVHQDVRRAMMRRFPYAVYYVVESKRVSVLRVLHQARDPRDWRQS